MALRTTRGALGDNLVSRWYWAVPFVVALFIYETRGAYLKLAAAALLAGLIVLLASQRPDRSLLVLVALVPFQGLLFAQLYAWGLPAELLRPLASWKEVLGLGVVVAGVRGFHEARRRIDRLDALAIAYVVVVAAYAGAPRLFAPGAPMEPNARSLAFRASAGFVLLLLGARHAPLPDGFVSRAAKVVLAVGSIIAAIAAYEYFFPDSWNSFVIERIQYLRYQVEVLHTTPFDSTTIHHYGHLGGREFIRVGSVLLDPLALGFYLVLPFAVAVERTVRTGLRSSAGATLVLIGAALLFTQTRAALIAALVVGFVAIRPAAGRATRQRLQFAIIFTIVLLVALPAAVATGLSERVTTASSGQEQSATDHIESLRNSLSVVRANPLGQGLGTSAGIGQRFRVANRTISENNYLQVALETGIIAMLVFIALTVTMLRYLRRATQAVDDIGIAAVRSAAVGLAIGALFLHTWNDFATAWPLWGLAGAAIGIAKVTTARRRPAPARPVPLAAHA